MLRRAILIAGIQRNPGKTYRLKDIFDAMKNQDAAEGAMWRSNVAQAEGSSVGCVFSATWGRRHPQLALARLGIAKGHLNERDIIV